LSFDFSDKNKKEKRGQENIKERLGDFFVFFSFVFIIKIQEKKRDRLIYICFEDRELVRMIT